MPQQYLDEFGIKPLGGDEFGIKPLGQQEEDEPEVPWYHKLASFGLRTVPAVAGGIMGSALPVAGNIAAGAAGAAVGNVLGQGYERYMGLRDDFNPYELGTETALGGVPGGFLLKGPGKAATAAALRNYAIKAPIGGAVEGAVLSAAGTPFQNWAQTGDLSFEGAGTNALYGAGFGAATGGALGSYPAIKQARGLEKINAAINPPSTPQPEVPPPPIRTEGPQRPIGPSQRPFDFGEAEPQLPFNRPAEQMPEPIYGPEIGPYGTPNPDQPRLPMEDEFGQMELGLPLTRIPGQEDLNTPFGRDIKGDSAAGGPEIIELRQATAANNKLMMSQGWEPYGISENGYPQMIKRPRPPVPQSQAPIQQSSQQPTPTQGTGESIPFNSDEGLVVPREIMSKTVIENLEKQGMELVEERPDGSGYFRHIAEPMESRRPPEEVMDDLRRMYGREPTQEEVQRAVDRQAREGEPTGQIAPFPSTATNLYEVTQAIRQGTGNPDALMQRAQQLINEYKTSNQARVDYVELSNLVNKAKTPDEAEFFQSLADSIKERGNQLNALEHQGFGEVRPLNEIRNQFIPDEGIPPQGPGDIAIPPGSEGGLDVTGIRQQNILDFRRPGRGPEIDLPQEMRVPNYREGSSGMENVALGGADPRVWDVVGSSLYARKRPVTTVKELLQNAWDEHKQTGVKEPVRVLINNSAENPRGGKEGRSITVRDRGRGLSPESIYTYLTNLGATGKAGVESAAGGFGFAKAAPFTGGKHVTVRSVIDTPDGRMMYSFEGTPAELKNQARGVPLNAEEVGPEIPTGLEVTTFYDESIPGFYDTAAWAQNMAQRSPSVETPTKIANSYSVNAKEARRWLDETPENPIGPNEYNYLAKHTSKDYSPQATPTLMDTISTPGADIKIHYDIPPGSEASEASLHMTNKGMYQGSKEFNYGDTVPNVPRSIVADIISKVEEGHEAYPFSANREQLSDEVDDAINKWVRENIITGVTQKRIKVIQGMYDTIAPLHPNKATGLDYLDEGNLLTPDELNQIANHPKMVAGLRVLEDIHKKMLEIADSLGWTPASMGSKWTYPSERLKKFGLLFKAPDSKGTVMGIHIPRPDDLNNSAILFNLMEHLNTAVKHGMPIDKLTAETIVTLAHEQAHIPGGGHDKGHSYRDADLRTAFGAQNTINWFDELNGVFGDGKQGINPEILDLLQIYNRSRQRKSSQPNALLATGISSTRQPDIGTGTGGNPPIIGAGKAGSKSVESGVLQEAYNLSRGITTTMDLSAPLRQGLPLITSKEWWKSWGQMLKSAGSEGAYQKTLSDLRKREIFQGRFDPKTGKITKSFAEQAGIKLMDVAGGITRREEAIASNWVETGGMFGKNNPVQRGYQKTVGRAARASNRAYTAFLNQLRADTFENLLKDASRDFKAGTKGARDPYTDMPFAKEIADFINTATGRGPLRTALPTVEGGKVVLREKSLEQNAKLLTNTIFSPRLMFSRVRMLNPATYMMASPFIRKQYVKSLLSVAGAWGTIAALAKGAGAEVSNDTNSADFGKIRIGDTRLDPAAGFQQYIVAASRLISGETTSSATGREFELGQGFRAETRGDVAQRFMTNKLHPVLKFANDLAFASQYQPFHVGDRTLQMFVPLVIQDILELSKEDPKLLPLIAPIAAGMGTQTYGKGESVGKFIPPENDYLFEGGALNLWDDTPTTNPF